MKAGASNPCLHLGKVPQLSAPLPACKGFLCSASLRMQAVRGPSFWHAVDLCEADCPTLRGLFLRFRYRGLCQDTYVNRPRPWLARLAVGLPVAVRCATPAPVSMSGSRPRRCALSADGERAAAFPQTPFRSPARRSAAVGGCMISAVAKDDNGFPFQSWQVGEDLYQQVNP